MDKTYKKIKVTEKVWNAFYKLISQNFHQQYSLRTFSLERTIPFTFWMPIKS